MADTIVQRAGRRWSVDSGGIKTLRRPYQVQIDGAYLGANGEATSFTGVPAIGSAHPSHSGLKVKSYDIEEGEGNEKKILTVWVNYETELTESVGEGSSAVNGAVEDFGWDDSIDERELITDVNGVPLVNSAGDPFDSVPRVSCPAPTFTKVIKFAAKQTGWTNSFCKVNSASIDVAGITCAKNTLLCTVSEKRIFGDPNYNWRYTIRLRYRSNKVVLSGTGSAQEIGWQVSVTDAGMREVPIAGAVPVLIRTKDALTGKPVTVTSPELLDGQGHAVSRSGGTVTPYNFKFAAYEEVQFPAWFYSTPAT